MVEYLPVGVDIAGLFQNAGEPVFLVNGRRRVVLFNHACEELTGLPAERVLGLECRHHGPIESADLASLAGSLCPPPAVLAGEAQSVHALLLQSGGVRSWRRIQFLPLAARDGSVAVIFGRIGPPEPTPETPPAGSRPREGLLRLRQKLYAEYGFDHLVAASPEMRRVLDQVRLASQTTVPVLLQGEKGAGKERLARTIHYQGGDRNRPFVALDCAALPPALIEQELSRARQADGVAAGVIYLREPACLPRDVHSGVRALLERAPPEAGTRLMAGSSVDLAVACRTGTFPEAVFYRLGTLTIHVPPLRERGPDLLLLIQQILERGNAEGDKQVLGLAPAAQELVEAYPWPGNLAELDDVLAQAHLDATTEEIQVGDLPARLRTAVELAAMPTAAPERPLPLDELLANAERRLIELALQSARGNKTKAAARLRVSRARLLRRMALLGFADAEAAETEIILDPAPDPEDGGPETPS